MVQPTSATHVSSDREAAPAPSFSEDQWHGQATGGLPPCRRRPSMATHAMGHDSLLGARTFKVQTFW